MFLNYEYIIVGAGLYGSVMARKLHDAGKSVIVIDKRDHIGGNCYSKIDELTGIEYHVYGSHIFHTSSNLVIDFISKFTKFNNYKHKVFSKFVNTLYPMPVNLETINKYFNRCFTPPEAKAFIDELIAQDIKQPKYGSAYNEFELAAINRISVELYSAFIEEYTVKQWGCSTDMLPGDIIKRLPVRFNYDTNYFKDHFQGIPANEFTAVFNNLLLNSVPTMNNQAWGNNKLPC
jgi:UDP-galactopyranose mutase